MVPAVTFVSKWTLIGPIFPVQDFFLIHHNLPCPCKLCSHQKKDDIVLIKSILCSFYNFQVGMPASWCLWQEVKQWESQKSLFLTARDQQKSMDHSRHVTCYIWSTSGIIKGYSFTLLFDVFMHTRFLSQKTQLVLVVSVFWQLVFKP